MSKDILPDNEADGDFLPVKNEDRSKEEAPPAVFSDKSVDGDLSVYKTSKSYKVEPERPNLIKSLSGTSGQNSKSKSGASGAAVAIMVIGLILVGVGIFLRVPSTTLMTSYYLKSSDKYSVIEEYVGGDAYNYIIGASLVGGQISGMLTMKAVFIAVGILIFCIGLIFYNRRSEDQELFYGFMRGRMMLLIERLDSYFSKKKTEDGLK